MSFPLERKTGAVWITFIYPKWCHQSNTSYYYLHYITTCSLLKLIVFIQYNVYGLSLGCAKRIYHLPPHPPPQKGIWLKVCICHGWDWAWLYKLFSQVRRCFMNKPNTKLYSSLRMVAPTYIIACKLIQRITKGTPEYQITRSNDPTVKPLGCLFTFECILVSVNNINNWFSIALSFIHVLLL